MPADVRRILAIKNKHLGDIICNVPALLALHRQYPRAQLDVLVSSGTQALIAGFPWVHRVLETPAKTQGWTRVRRELSVATKIFSGGYDLVVDFTWSDRAMWYAILSRANQRWAIQVTAGFFLKPYVFKKHGGKPDPNHHVIEHERQFLMKMGLPPYDPEMTFPATDAEESGLNRWLETNHIDRKRLVIVHPTSRWLFKCWHDDRIAGLLDWLVNAGWQPVLTCGPSAPELNKARTILQLVKTHVSARLGDLNLRELAALLRQARFFFGVDSAPTHLAAAVKTPAVVLFGPTQVARWRPYGNIHHVLAGDCPCQRVKGKLCDKSRVMDCLDRISLAEVQSVIDRNFVPSSPIAG